MLERTAGEAATAQPIRGYPAFDRRARWLLIAATSRGSAERFARAHGIKVELLLDRDDLARLRGRLGRAIRARGIERVCVHTVDWSRESMPQLYIGALALSLVDDAVLVDEHVGRVTPLTRPSLAGQLARLPHQAIRGLGGAGWELARFVAGSARAADARCEPGCRYESVVAIWLGALESPVGGSVTHISGMLKAFRRAGLRVTLVAASAPPPQLREGFDELAPIPALPPSARLTRQVEGVLVNGPARSALRAALERLNGDAFVYQRHRPFLTAGLEAAQGAECPLVLEWNASEVWVQRNWARRRGALHGASISALGAIERRVARHAGVVAAISERAAAMALDAGAPPSAVSTVPNAVDVAEVRAALASGPAAVLHGPPTIGWIGSFGEWHGADVLVRALPLLDDEVGLLMIGEGRERRACQSLAAELGVGGRVHWAGQVPHAEALRMLRACDVLAAPHVPLRDGSVFFGSPIKVFEYMALGRPIVGSRLEQVGEVLEDGRTARLVRPGDPGDLAGAIRELLASPELARGLGAEARREVEANHTWDHRARAVLAALGGR